MESTITSQTNNNGKSSEQSLEEYYQSYSNPLLIDGVFGDKLDILLVKAITESTLQMADSIDKIAEILTDATVTFAAANESVAVIMNNIIQTEAMISLVAAITPTLRMN
ncbi:hypothetical protein [Arsenophonus apicola]|uniref:hypothetical protein n=1 Tax=Arsenophonus apicola TaxID=2879119 RepID=UPI003879B865